MDPQIASLRGDLSPQREAQLALEKVRDEWRHGVFAKARADLSAFGQGRALGDCPDLARLLSSREEAYAILDALFEPMTAALARYPLGQVPMRHQQSNGLAMIQLGRTGRATLTLLTYDALEQRPDTVAFSGSDCHEIVLEGAGDFRFTELLEERDGVAALDQQVRRLVAGETLSCDARRQVRYIEQVHGRLVMLRLARTDENAQPTRQFSLADGRLVHSASGTREESQREMAMALLGRMGRSDAAPLLAELAMEGGAHIRWQSLRECLALDTATGFGVLSRIAADPADELAAQAGALRAQLVEAYPVLAQLESEACPA
ncbi:hypothetical protein [Qipengyuania sphaerica]|uniref:hypothetical protein n=1 Tax=Qipengyuania sphaerica TaxID=2867243 RepID=UPI001C8873AE|nr:hypothetical protein [Qipengyuania sphaerica]MBX7541004.1 hypothetical protein [Qipengyuania sphaerica]